MLTISDHPPNIRCLPRPSHRTHQPSWCARDRPHNDRTCTPSTPGRPDCRAEIPVWLTTRNTGFQQPVVGSHTSIGPRHSTRKPGNKEATVPRDVSPIQTSTPRQAGSQTVPRPPQSHRAWPISRSRSALLASLPYMNSLQTRPDVAAELNSFPRLTCLRGNEATGREPEGRVSPRHSQNPGNGQKANAPSSLSLPVTSAIYRTRHSREKSEFGGKVTKGSTMPARHSP